MVRDENAPGVVGPFAGLDVPWLLRMQAEQRRDHPFLIWAPFDQPARSWSYGEFHDRVGALAAGLAKRGVKPGEYVLIHLDNCIEAMLTWFACVELGAIAVTTNTRSAAAEIAYFADHCGAVAAITQPAYAELVAGNCRKLRWIAVISHDSGEAPAQGHAVPQAERFEALFADSADRPRRPIDPMAPCSVQYTSGTTSRPKAVLWTHANALWGAKINAVHQTLRADDVHLAYLPLFHTNALAYSVLATLWVGASCVIQPRFSARRFWGTALEHRCTWASTIGFCLKALLDYEVPKQHSFRLWGTAFCEPPAFAKFGIKIVGWWGMTETISHGIIGEVDQPNIPMSIGRAAPEYTLRVTDDDGAPTPVGSTGNLLIKGVPGLSLFKEYLHNEAATRDSFDAHGYFITGDRVTLLERGFIKFGDRAKDMLKVGGENVAASEIEQVVAMVPGVREAAVVAKKHPMLDEVPVVFVIPSAGVAEAAPDLHDQVMAACRDALADFKVPREIRLVDEMPRSTLEKVAKAELRKLLE
ncbi:MULTISPECIES: AMP-binding protein [Rhodopseudomonas]|uniref:AMP-dependent synthetase n=1 Tax=Rhodopseudomonas palustris TaxID=1076 RepID=A0A0D7E8J0_RHOPL|nr:MULTISPECIES: AMP-binding protein [Rhodopseudomonas]KIZ35867.1 AMP-dependent synthetase [Rhodopseudomonas palustris]MDF3813958.1 AMP-binding protein [Rhodopseudomonas sp. BAL398]WOK16797.1 AMP-binding protein [Rhodopseudomonas sp. BAL398]